VPWPDAAVFVPFVLVALTINVSPGPDLLYVVAQTLAGDARLGRWAALGIGTGSLCQALLAAAGLSSLLATSPQVLTALSWAGAAYLAWIGIDTLRQPARFGVPPDPDDPSAVVLTAAEVFRRGVVTNLLNPKVVLFYLTFLPQFVRPAAGPEWQQVLLFGLTFNAMGTLVLLGVVEISGWIGRQLQLEQRQRRAAVLRKLPGVIFLGLAVHLVWP
jgi:threonine/homoserine/homoserine lactone efflux protein